MKYRVEIDGYTKTTQYAIIEAESEEKAIVIFIKGKELSISHQTEL
jgi:hypothetical protein